MTSLLSSSASAAPSDAEAEAVGRGLVAELDARAFGKAVARFDAAMAKAMSEAQLRATWEGLLGQVGAFAGVLRARTEKKPPFLIAVLTCKFARAELDVQVVVDATKRVGGLWLRPASAVAWTAPAYATTAPEERELEIVTPAAPGPAVSLPARLALPKGPGPFAAIVLVHGSGPNDMDETVGGCKPFKDLAWGLAARGIAVLRYHKRTHQYPERFSPSQRYSVKDETIDDARSAVALLARTPKIDPKRIFVLGHSLGGTVAPRIALGEPRVAGLIVLAGASRPIDELLLEQMRQLSPERVKETEALVRRLRDPKTREGDTVEVLGTKMRAGYWLDLRRQLPGPIARKFRIPILVLQGGRDYQVRLADFEGWKRALEGRPLARLKLLPALNHLFVAGKGPSTPAEYQLPGHVDREVVDEIAKLVRP